MSEQSTLKETEKRLAELREIIMRTQSVEVEKLYWTSLDAVGGRSSVMARELNIQLACARAYIGELHRRLDDSTKGEWVKTHHIGEGGDQEISALK